MSVDVLCDAAKEGDLLRVTSLLDQGVNIDGMNRFGKTPLHFATEKGHFSLVQLLIDKGSNVNAKDGSGWTHLHIAVHGGHLSIVQLLIDRGSDVNARTTHGNIPSDFAGISEAVADYLRGIQQNSRSNLSQSRHK
eukprot:TRINITY_DN538_c0_g2_i1.p1 TRINITY_DN538_c0_g2~~TRINITY_DN538_c0_g2_i1.p1  ORF type:complete len:136 (-),score=31.84 TRINITY_DN538_c0_g2_i1:42-449(-)